MHKASKLMFFYPYLKFAELVYFFSMLLSTWSVFLVSCRGSMQRDIGLSIPRNILSKLRSSAVRSSNYKVSHFQRSHNTIRLDDSIYLSYIPKVLDGNFRNLKVLSIPNITVLDPILS